MGLFDTVIFKKSKKEKIDIHFKNLESNMTIYEIGSDLKLNNGIYFGLEGCFVVYNNRIVASFDEEEDVLFDKWDNKLDYPDLSDGLKKNFGLK